MRIETRNKKSHAQRARSRAIPRLPGALGRGALALGLAVLGCGGEDSRGEPAGATSSTGSATQATTGSGGGEAGSGGGGPGSGGSGAGGSGAGGSEPAGPSIVIDGETHTLTWADEFGGDLGAGQPRSPIDDGSWSKENLGVNFEQQAYTNRECTDHPDTWNYCVEDGKLTLLAREEPLDCVVWKTCAGPADCDASGTCMDGYCLSDQNRNGVWDHDECAPHTGIANPPANGMAYTSGRLSTDEKVELRYGYLEFRARMPFAELAAGAVPPSGMWPAIWLLGANGAIKDGGVEDSVGWPMNGEIDVMEYTQIKENPALYPDNKAMGFNALWRERPEAGELAANPGGWEPNACSAWPNGGDAKCDADVGGARSTWDGVTIDYHAWHTWGFLWDEDSFAIYIDDLPQDGGTPVGVFSIGEGATEYRQPMYLIMNLAVGGELGCLGWKDRACSSAAGCANGAACVDGKCDETPSSCIDVDWAAQGDLARLEVDYVRWYHRASGYPRLPSAACQDGDGDGDPDNIIKNCGFNEDHTSHRSDIFFEGGGGLTEIIDEGGDHGHVQWVRVDNGGTQPWNVQVRQEGFPLAAATEYSWHVDLRASAPRVVPIKIALAHDPWTTIATFDCDVGTAWSTCSPPSFTPESAGTYKFEIDLGNDGANTHDGTEVTVDDIYLGTADNACQPDCTGASCGDDRCGGTCGACAAGLSCTPWGQCAAGAD
ncbi:glycosyl hydrolase [Sorangium sp. So ce233]|uniref:glycosyl hydrolase n=1 Tax=Sorangium sp. So ce233 TaxID=3133290 RepID=UPI003F5FB264